MHTDEHHDRNCNCWRVPRVQDDCNGSIKAGCGMKIDFPTFSFESAVGQDGAAYGGALEVSRKFESLKGAMRIVSPANDRRCVWLSIDVSICSLNFHLL